MKRILFALTFISMFISCSRDDENIEPIEKSSSKSAANSSSNLREIVIGNGELLYSFDKYGYYNATTENTPLTLTVTNLTTSPMRVTFEIASGSIAHGNWGVPGAVRATSVIANNGLGVTFESDSKLQWRTGFIPQGQSRQLTLNMKMSPLWGVEGTFGAIIIDSFPTDVQTSLDFTDDQCYFIRGFN